MPAADTAKAWPGAQRRWRQSVMAQVLPVVPTAGLVVVLVAVELVVESGVCSAPNKTEETRNKKY